MAKKPRKVSFDENKHTILNWYEHYHGDDMYGDFVLPRLGKKEPNYNRYLLAYEVFKSKGKKLSKNEYMRLIKKYKELYEESNKPPYSSDTYDKMEKIKKTCLLY